MLALASPIWAQAIMPPFKTSSGLTPKNSGFHCTRSAHFPGSTLPPSAPTQGVIARSSVDLADAGYADDVGGMAAAGAFGVVGVDGAAGDGGDRVFHETRFVQRIRVDGHLHVELVGDGQTAVDRRGGGAPVFVQFQAAGAGSDL